MKKNNPIKLAEEKRNYNNPNYKPFMDTEGVLDEASFNYLASRKGGFIGFEPPTTSTQCPDPEHLPPSHIVLKAGKHTYQCPSCGHITIVNVPQISF